MRIVFSRKGFDSASGGCPCPIIDGVLVTLPIPTKQPTPTTFGRLLGDRASLVSDLTHRKYNASSPCHLDPDIDASCLGRQPGWRGSLGQAGTALAHLDNQGVTTRDLFIFWGCYRAAQYRDGLWRFAGPTVHAIYGWLQVGMKHQLGEDGSHLLGEHPWLADHPHVRPGWPTANALYVATEQLSLPGLTAHLPGWGVMRRGHVLSAPDANPSIWRVPDWLHSMRERRMSYHRDESRWRADGTVQTVARGQEFVADIGKDARVGQWFQRLVECNR